jgi:hypothetical protein
MRRIIIVVVLGVVGAVSLMSCGGSSSGTTAEPAAVNTNPVAVLPPLLPAATLGCGLPAQPDLHNTCPKTEPRYLEDVRGAVQYVMGTRSDLVDSSGRVLDHRGYTNAVVQRLRAQGYCAVDQLEEIAIKKTNEFNEQYNVWTSLGQVRMSYISTCFPAQF